MWFVELDEYLLEKYDCKYEYDQLWDCVGIGKV